MKKKNYKILINILTHGDELIGLRVKKELEKLQIKKDVLDFNIANPKAYKSKKRYIDEDLNRVFPGKKNGNHEERLAYSISKKIKKYDLVIDIHSTKSDLKDALIVTKLDEKTKNIIDVITPKNLLVMRISKDNALISRAKIGIAFEYGKDSDKKVLENILRDIKKILIYFDLIENNIIVKKTKNYSNYVRSVQTGKFVVNKTFKKKPGYILDSKIKNYKFVRKGQIIAVKGDKAIKAKEDFYPILFGNKNYDTMFGFIGKKKK